jgi:flavin reductase (DIM6/NTAB) family NADH-FMN oxidoreductase RutF
MKVLKFERERFEELVGEAIDQLPVEFVINLPGKDQIDSIMVFGKSYPEGVNEIKEAGLTETESTVVKPPGIAEYKAHVECRFKWEKEVGSHMLVAGEILAGSCDEGLLDEKGYFDVVKAGILHIVRYPEPVYISPEKYVEGKR